MKRARNIIIAAQRVFLLIVAYFKLIADEEVENIDKFCRQHASQPAK
jgi:hypothetical protein